MMHELPASPTSSSTETMSSHTPTKKRKVGVPKFLRYLYQILEKEDSAIISWANGGTSIQILDTDRVAQYILPKYFKHSKYASFQRQLNYFGFRKWTKSQTNICTFSHPEFRQNRPDRLYLIKRKNSPESARKKPSSKTTSHEKTAPMPPMLHFQMRQHLHPMAPMSYDFLAPASTSSSPSAGFQRALFPNDVLDFNPTKKESMLFGFQSKPSPTTTPLPSTHLLSDIENLQIQGDGPSFSLLDVNHMMFGGGASTPLPPSMLPDFKDSTNETHFDFDMNCAWLDSFTPVDPVAYPNGPPFNHAEYA
ncbi:hypothetical protein SPRG_00136 [Saprolegnia parasitica CBS 223.65]|uniref:HSF-type DNA-binding domain-containing protein n=1 Tax=Saprolegnia parasitica (strain CBS 223.65) TaxID=695850 RepID=A0A067CX72_SAPPC|nr:hypothetical protein SPRG_00136 [Saprolegnia parasitica CBS 223.65]KDO35289.1 hypothetical protein SPRG_00136 [Saprolegnia parasitica CBS 223.65]|eukprot:XP_012193637.1 hypothetical protein SPRG_00136 [Saprolegnia parasitica CBS 223.65]